MERVYLSGAITGIADYLAQFNRVEKQLTRYGYAVVNPARICLPLADAEFTWQEYLDVDLNLLDKCSMLCLLPGWKTSRGANVERDYALRHGITVVEWETLNPGMPENQQK